MPLTRDNYAIAIVTKMRKAPPTSNNFMPSDEAAAEQTLEVMFWMALDMQPMYF